MKSTMLKMMIVSILVMMFCRMTYGHGMMVQPLQRSSMWRDSRFRSAPTNYDDNALFCGGFSRQFYANGGKCGICGDAYDAPQPRPNEAGGKFATGVITETYKQGEVIDVAVKITANHLGYFIFKLCPNNDVTKEATQECLDQHVLRAVGQNGEDLGEHYYIDSGIDVKRIKLQLPSDVSCTQCVLQWTYNTGNSWGCGDDKCCQGCGPQENFVNCADIAITGSGGSGNPHTTTTTKKPCETNAPVTPKKTTITTARPTTPTPRPTTTTPRPTTTSTARPKRTTARPTTPTPRPTSRPKTSTATTTTTTKKPATAAPQQPDFSNCRPVGIWARMRGMKKCVDNCARRYCTVSYCTCS